MISRSLVTNMYCIAAVKISGKSNIGSKLLRDAKEQSPRRAKKQKSQTHKQKRPQSPHQLTPLHIDIEVRTMKMFSIFFRPSILDGLTRAPAGSKD